MKATVTIQKLFFDKEGTATNQEQPFFIKEQFENLSNRSKGKYINILSYFPLGLTLESAFNVKAKGTLTRATILLYHSSMRPASIFEHSTNIQTKVTLPISMINKKVILYLRVASIQKFVFNPIFYSLYLRVASNIELLLFRGVWYSTLIKIAHKICEKFNIYGNVLNLWTRL